MSRLLKAIAGCLALLVLILVIIAGAAFVGGRALLQRVEGTVGGAEEHRAATAAFERLEAEHPFQPPADGRLTEAQVRRFLAVTDAAWPRLEPWAQELEALARHRRAEPVSRPGLRELLAGARAAGGLGRARLALAEALQQEGQSLGEYAWTGISLARAVSALDEGPTRRAPDVPQANLELVERYAAELPRLDGSAGRGLVPAVAILWGATEAPTWRALGLDSLAAAGSRRP